MKQLLLSFLVTAPAILSAQTFEWAHAYSDVGETVGTAVATDASGNVFTAGTFGDVTDFDSGAGTLNLTPNGASDVFITKTGAAGNLIWAKAIGGGGYDIVYDIATDAAGNVYLTGMFHFLCDFDTGAGNMDIASNGGADVFVLKLTSAGNLSWVKTFGGPEDDYGFGIALDAAGNVHTTGYFANTVDFNPGAGTANMTASGYNGFVSKLDAAGNYLWASNLGGFGDELPKAIALDVDGNVYTTGGFSGTADFDPGPGVFSFTATDLNSDTYLSKLDAAGNFVWAKQFGGVETDNGHAVAVDSQNNVYLAGEFRGIFDSDPNAGTANLFVAGPEDGFVVKLTSAGNYIWSRKVGGINDDAVYSLAVDETDRIYMTGYFQGTVDFDPGAGNYSLTSFASQQDTYVCKLDGSGNFNWAVAVNAPHNGNIGYDVALGPDAVYATGSFLQFCDFDTGSGVFTLISAGSNDAFLMKHHACDPVAGTAVITACDSYTWIDGVTYTADNNTATYALQSAQGCDSIVTLNLTLTHSTTSTTSVTACNSYTWSNGMTYTTSGTYTQTLTNSFGCDSVATLQLTINTAIPTATITQTGGTFTANATTGTYQWVNCNDGSYISGATAQSFTPAENGSYAVLINEGGCTDYSECIVIGNVGLEETKEGEIGIYPNPTTGVFVLLATDAVHIVLTDASGKVVLEQQLKEGENTIDLKNAAAGVYFLKAAHTVQKVIVEK